MKTLNFKQFIIENKLTKLPNKHISDGTFSIMTKELSNRLKTPIKITQGYLFRFFNDEELNKLKEQYKIGGEYNGEEIIYIEIYEGEIEWRRDYLY